MPRFPDLAEPLGLDVPDLAGGVIADDFDNDGFLDIVASSWALTGQLRFFRNRGDGTFEERTSEAGLVGITSGLNIYQTDYNNDGFVDVWLPAAPGWASPAAFRRPYCGTTGRRVGQTGSRAAGSSPRSRRSRVWPSPSSVFRPGSSTTTTTATRTSTSAWAVRSPGTRRATPCS